MRRVRTLYQKYPKQVEIYWDNEKNQLLNLSPKELCKTSDKKAWFICPVDGHSWESAMKKINYYWRDGKSGCPVCLSKKKIEEGLSLVDNYPKQLKKYWDYEKNKIPPQHFSICSNKKAFFKCPIDGHQWSSIIEGITNSWSKKYSGCLVCKRSVLTEYNALIKLFPYHVEEYWHYEKNNELGIYPDEVTRGSNKKAWFKCPVDGNQWYSHISHVTNAWRKGNSGCQVCKLFYQSTKRI
jgi:hypothetical protein